MDIRYKDFYACRMSNSTEVTIVPENTIIAYVIPGVKKDMWNSQYARGLGSDDAWVEHRTVFKCADVVDQRKQTDG